MYSRLQKSNQSSITKKIKSNAFQKMLPIFLGVRKILSEKNHKGSNTFSYVSNFICILNTKQKCAVSPSPVHTKTEKVGDWGICSDHCPK